MILDTSLTLDPKVYELLDYLRSASTVNSAMADRRKKGMTEEQIFEYLRNERFFIIF